MVGGVITRLSKTSKEALSLTLLPNASVTSTVRLKVPVAVGTPEIRPVALSMFNQDGPDVMSQE
jgi:hypothetical protein